jgi:hypothetical protein
VRAARNEEPERETKNEEHEMADLTCQSCAASFPDTELFCPACGTAVIPQLSTAEVGKLQSRHKEMPGIIRRGGLVGFLVGIALIPLALLVYWPTDLDLQRSWVTALAAGVLLGLLGGTIAGFLIHRRREANAKK